MARLDYDGDDDVAEALARCFPHDPPYGLHHVDLAVPGIKERDGVELRDVHPFGEELNPGYSRSSPKVG